MGKANNFFDISRFLDMSRKIEPCHETPNINKILMISYILSQSAGRFLFWHKFWIML